NASWSSAGACSTTTRRRPEMANRFTIDPMATPASAKPTPAEAPPTAAIKPAKPAGPRPDLATISGIALAMAGIIGGLILEKGSIQDVAQGTAAMIVLGGTFGAVLVTTPMAHVLRAV